MLPQQWRMRSSGDFSRTMRLGFSGGSKHLAVHYLADQHPGQAAGLVGFVVPKRSVKKAVDRNRIKRQLRHIVANSIKEHRVQPGDNIVIRVFSGAMDQRSDVLSASFQRALAKAKAKEERQ